MQKSEHADNQDRADFHIWEWLGQIMGVISLYHSTDAEAISPYHVQKSQRADNQDRADFRIWGCLDQIRGVI